LLRVIDCPVKNRGESFDLQPQQDFPRPPGIRIEGTADCNNFSPHCDYSVDNKPSEYDFIFHHACLLQLSYLVIPDH